MWHRQWQPFCTMSTARKHPICEVAIRLDPGGRLGR
jgi:hypothetical protein